MSYSYLIKIDKDLINEKDEILKYIMDEINQDNMLDKINDIKCMTNKDLTNICREKISDLGKIIKQKNTSTELCGICNNCFSEKEYIFTFNVCKHRFHKKCVNMYLKSNALGTICYTCKDFYLPNIINIV
jgi:hypothetical protein